jgi:hypothetical protein
MQIACLGIPLRRRITFIVATMTSQYWCNYDSNHNVKQVLVAQRNFAYQSISMNMPLFAVSL